MLLRKGTSCNAIGAATSRSPRQDGTGGHASSIGVVPAEDASRRDPALLSVGIVSPIIFARLRGDPLEASRQTKRVASAPARPTRRPIPVRGCPAPSRRWRRISGSALTALAACSACGVPWSSVKEMRNTRTREIPSAGRPRPSQEKGYLHAHGEASVVEQPLRLLKLAVHERRRCSRGGLT